MTWGEGTQAAEPDTGSRTAPQHRLPSRDHPQYQAELACSPGWISRDGRPHRLFTGSLGPGHTPHVPHPARYALPTRGVRRVHLQVWGMNYCLDGGAQQAGWLAGRASCTNTLFISSRCMAIPKPSAAFPLPLTQGATPLPTSAHPRGDPQKPGQRQLLRMEASAGEPRRERLTFCWEEGERRRRKPPKCQRR